MKLNIVPPRAGLQWVRLGVKTFFRQPLAMSGLFFMFMAASSVLSLVPLLGTAIWLTLVPAATLGLMAASREAALGRFPMPSTLISAFRGGAARTRAILTLGAMYAAGAMLAFGVASLFAPEVAPVVDMPGGEVTPAMVRNLFDSPSLWVAMALSLPLLMAFWHAPALVHWHGVSPLKSLFFSFLACWSNKGAMLLYLVGWVGVFTLGGLVMSLLGVVVGGAEALNLVLYPMALFMASMFQTSIYFTFVDSFVAPDAPTPTTTGEDA
jgi:hypothetical protein